MKRQMKASAVAVLISGCLLALSATAADPMPSAAERQKAETERKLVQAAREKEAARCFDCTSRSTKAMEACSQNCPMNDPSKKEAAGKCLNKCSDKYHAATETCSSVCSKPRAETANPPEPSKAR